MRAYLLVTCASVIAVASIARADVSPSASPLSLQAHAEQKTTLGHFATTFLHDDEHRARAYNLTLAAEAIDGQTIAPGATFSFNHRVGERTASFGFEKSIVIRDRMMAEGSGGGTCQVASTLFAAALLSGLTIVSRAPHSRPSGYVRVGLDATVAFPRIDLKLKNPRSNPIVVHARAFRGSLDVWFEDANVSSDPLDVRITSEIVERFPFTRSIERDRNLPPNVVRVRSRGIPGYRVRVTREIRSANGIVRDVHIDTYAPTSEVFVVSDTFDVTRLEKRSDAKNENEDLDAGSNANASSTSVIFRDDPGVVHPTGLQLWPEHEVVFTNR